MALPADTPAGLFPGVPYDYASVVAAGSVIFTAGACPIDGAGIVVAPDDHGAQAGLAVDNLLAVLRLHGGDASHLVRTTVYVVGDRADLATVWATVAERLAPHRPASTLLGVTALGYLGQLVEIDGVAALGAPPQPTTDTPETD